MWNGPHPLAHNYQPAGSSCQSSLDDRVWTSVTVPLQDDRGRAPVFRSISISPDCEGVSLPTQWRNEEGEKVGTRKISQIILHRKRRWFRV